MFARSVSCTLKPGRVTEFNTTFEKDVIPVLRKQNGFQDEIAFVAEGTGTEVVAISLWDKKEDAEAYQRGSYSEVLKALAKVVDGTPEVRNFEVASSTLQRVPALVAA